MCRCFAYERDRGLFSIVGGIYRNDDPLHI